MSHWKSTATWELWALIDQCNFTSSEAETLTHAELWACSRTCTHSTQRMYACVSPDAEPLFEGARMPSVYPRPPDVVETPHNIDFSFRLLKHSHLT